MGTFTRIFKTFDEIESTSSTNGKLALLEGLIKDTSGDATLSEIIRYTYNPFTSYYVTPKMPTNTVTATMGDEQLTNVWNNVKNALNAMSARELSGNDAKRTMQMVLENLPETPRKYFYRIFNRDLKIGLALGTFAKYFDGIVATSKPFLCVKFDAKKDRKFKTMCYPVWCETKWDGVRCVAIVDENGVPSLLSREMKVLFNTELVADIIKRSGLRSVVLDGELGVPEDFTLTNTITGTQKVHPDRDKMMYFVFDAMPLSDWVNAKSTMVLEERKALAAKLIKHINNPKIQPTRSVLCHNSDELLTEYSLATKQGFEGIVTKRAGSYYKFTGKKTGTDWQKAKPVEETDVIVLEAKPGENDAWTANTCGRLLYKGYADFDGKTYYVEGKVGSGLTQKQRDDFWRRHQAGTLAGTVIQIEYQEPAVPLDDSGKEVITHNDKGERIWSLRFPTFKRERPDKSVKQVMSREG